MDTAQYSSFNYNNNHLLYQQQQQLPQQQHLHHLQHHHHHHHHLQPQNDQFMLLDQVSFISSTTSVPDNCPDDLMLLECSSNVASNLNVDQMCHQQPQNQQDNTSEHCRSISIETSTLPEQVNSPQGDCWNQTNVGVVTTSSALTTCCTPSPSVSAASPSTTTFFIQSPDSNFSTSSPCASTSTSTTISNYNNAGSSSPTGTSENQNISCLSPIGYSTPKSATETLTNISKCQAVQTKQQQQSKSLATSATSGDKTVIKRIRRVKANYRERNRMHNLNEALERLRKHLPAARDEPKMSKIETLKSAQEYITTLSRLLLETGGSDIIVKQQQQQQQQQPSQQQKQRSTTKC